VAIWEIKEYYYTTTFGSRVADAIYESLLDGFELVLARQESGLDALNYLFLDSRAWWTQGKSYLCRVVDSLNMGYTSEVIFGAEVFERLPKLTKEWVRALKQRG
jgi:hypothetical protein